MEQFLSTLLEKVLPAFLWWMVIPFLGICLLHSFVNMRLLRRLKPSALNEQEAEKIQNVSILVPARNEEKRIHSCLSSLIAQQPPVREIILLDDRSSDATLQIAQELGFCEGEGNRLHLLRGRELPVGWVGKNWACHQLYQVADAASTHLLFTDADTIHGPACVRTALAFATEQRIDLLSLWPDQMTETWSEKLIIPLLYLLAMVFYPLALLLWFQEKPEWIKKTRFTLEQLSKLGAANGQFLLFRWEAYLAIGGHEALKDHLVEDVAFGRRMAARTGEGMRLCNADGAELLRCRMYASLAEVWGGFSKNIRPVFEESVVSFFIFGSLLGGFFFAPFFLLFFTPFTRGLFMPVLTSILLIFLIRLFLTLRFRTAWLSLIAHPIGMILAILIGLNSWRLCLRGEVSWKGRTYSGTTRSALGKH